MTLKDTLDKMDLIDIYRTFHPKATEYIFFSNAHGLITKVDHKLSLYKFDNIEIISSIFSDHNEWNKKSTTIKILKNIQTHGSLKNVIKN